MTERIVRVAVPVPVRGLFDYWAPDATLRPGVRVEVPFGRRRLVGVVWACVEHAEVAAARLRPITQVLDAEPLLLPPLQRLLRWAARYYHHPEGEVVLGALPPLLRQARPLPQGRRVYRRLPQACAGAPGRGPVARSCWARLEEGALEEGVLSHPR
ncbi:MAG TPA: hypothetical protein VFN52_05935, partial [Acidiferrobacteraceae bacterium]|nr:hypothetical protein [Acidiferrobacteraceae bacterium]